MRQPIADGALNLFECYLAGTPLSIRTNWYVESFLLGCRNPPLQIDQSLLADLEHAFLWSVEVDDEQNDRSSHEYQRDNGDHVALAVQTGVESNHAN